jgi:hypothetical protein
MVVVTPPSKGFSFMSTHAEASTLANLCLLEALIDTLHAQGILAREAVADMLEAAVSKVDETTRAWAGKDAIMVATETLTHLAQDWREPPEEA